MKHKSNYRFHIHQQQKKKKILFSLHLRDLERTGVNIPIVNSLVAYTTHRGDSKPDVFDVTGNSETASLEKDEVVASSRSEPGFGDVIQRLCGAAGRATGVVPAYPRWVRLEVTLTCSTPAPRLIPLRVFLAGPLPRRHFLRAACIGAGPRRGISCVESLQTKTLTPTVRRRGVVGTLGTGCAANAPHRFVARVKIVSSDVMAVDPEAAPVQTGGIDE